MYGILTVVRGFCPSFADSSEAGVVEVCVCIAERDFQTFIFSSGPTTGLLSRKKKRAIAQQTIGITDNVAACASMCTL